MSHSIFKPLLALLLCAVLPCSWAGQAMMYVADDLEGMQSALDQATTAAIATQDSPIVLIIKDTQVSLAQRGSAFEHDLREALASKVQVFVCEADLIRYGIAPTKLLPGITLSKAPVRKTEGSAPAAVEAQPLARFTKQAEKVCDQ